MGIEQFKNDLLLKESLREKTEDERARDKRIAKGLRDIPVRKMIDNVLYIRNNLLPAIKKKSGDKSADFLVFSEIADSLLYAIILSDRFDALERMATFSKIRANLLTENMALYERELQKYCALEDLFLTDGLDRYADSVKRRAEGLLRR
jgi:hypothetical protein